MAKVTKARPKLYNPKWICAAALIFTPIFGGLLQARNWEQLGMKDEARASRFWVRSSVWLVGLYLVMQTLFRHEPVMAYMGPWFLLVLWGAWMATHGRRQLAHVRDFVKDYELLPFGKTMTMGILGWVLYGMLSFTITLALMITGFEPFEEPVKAPENGVIIRMNPGDEKPTVEELSPPEEAAKTESAESAESAQSAEEAKHAEAQVEAEQEAQAAAQTDAGVPVPDEKP